MSDKDIEINSSSNYGIAISSHSIEIQHKGKPVISALAEVGFAYLVIDCSGSMAGDKLNQAQKGALHFAKEALSKNYSTGLIQFDSYPNHLSEPTREISILKQCLERMVAGGSTNMAAAIRIAHRKLAKKTGSRAMVIVTDGMPDNVADSLKAGIEAKKDNIDIITIGTDDANQEFLKKLSSRSELGVKVSREQFEQGIASSAKMLRVSTSARGLSDKKAK